MGEVRCVRVRGRCGGETVKHGECRELTMTFHYDDEGIKGKKLTRVSPPVANGNKEDYAIIQFNHTEVKKQSCRWTY